MSQNHEAVDPEIRELSYRGKTGLGGSAECVPQRRVWYHMLSHHLETVLLL